MPRSASSTGQYTLAVTALLVLLAGFGSVEEPETVAWLLMLASHRASAGTVKETVMVLLWPFVRLKVSQRMFPPFTTHPGSDAAGSNVSGTGWPREFSTVGMGSAIVTFVAVLGPRFVAVRSKLTRWPGSTIGWPVLLMVRSASVTGHSTVVCTCWLALFSGFGSVEEAETVAWLLMMEEHSPVSGMVKEISTVLSSPAFRVKLSQRMFPPFTTHAGSDCAGLKTSGTITASVSCGMLGMVSAITTFVAVSGPAFVAVTVYVTVLPRMAVCGPVFVTERSAVCAGQFTMVETIWLRLFCGFGSPCGVLCTRAWLWTEEPQEMALLVEKVSVRSMLSPFTRLMPLQTTSAPLTRHPAELPPALKVSPAGMGSAISTPVASPGPLFVTVST